MIPSLVLASASPRRSTLLTRMGLPHTVAPAEIDETPLSGEQPGPHVERLSRQKAAAVSSLHPESLILAGDTVVVSGGRILGKPADIDAAIDMLMRLSGRSHEVLWGLALTLPGGPTLARVDRTAVHFRSFTREWARDYVATGEPMDKAGAYGIQGLGGALVTGVEGDYTTVVGLSVSGLVELLHEGGWSYRFGRLDPRSRRLPEE